MFNELQQRGQQCAAVSLCWLEVHR